ncbi:MAG: class I mannose-6-phosphate isomerase [Ginsengibacter sp.]
MNNSNFDKFPEVPIKGYYGFKGWEEIGGEINRNLNKEKKKSIIVIECYPGVLIDPFINAMQSQIGNITFIDASSGLKPEEEITKMVFPFVTDDPVFGYVTSLSLLDFFDENSLKKHQKEIEQQDKGIICIYGIGASLFYSEPDVLIYADMPRWEIQLRFRNNWVGNLGASNFTDEFSYKYKRAFFVDWKVCDRVKMDMFEKMDYVLDSTIQDAPKMITGKTFLEAMKQVVKRPFSVVPFFDPGPWGGQWLKEVCDLDRSKVNYAWGFVCVPEENSLLLRFDNILFETASINLVYYQPRQLLGDKVYEAFGAEFPIRFDFLDTMEGGNLSLQVHPLTEYIHEKFGMNYTQNESYYFLDAKEDAVVYLGLKDNIVPDKMLEELEAAQEEGGSFDTDKFVEKWSVKKHDHVLIPAGTVHCSGANTVVLEISATPYIFTFKLWDWDRLGLNGKPRPISLKHGREAIQWDRTIDWTRDNILDKVEKTSEGDGWIEEKTGLHEGSFIETHRHWFTKKVFHETDGVVNILNLVEGREVIVESPSGAFEPFIIHYAETFIVPAEVGAYTVRPTVENGGKRCATMKAIVRIENIPHNRIN